MRSNVLECPVRVPAGERRALGGKMTLCIAWQDLNELYFGTDSRVMFGGRPPVDTCAKVVRLPISVRILGTESDREEFAVGLAFAGSFITAYTVREILQELLPLAQVVPERVKVSLPLFVGIIRKLLEDVCRQVSVSMFEAGAAEFLVGGFCPAAQTVRLFSIKPRIPLGTGFLEEELPLDRPHFIGSGASRAREIAVGRRPNEMAAVLRTIIRDESVADVGGPIQFGKSEGRDFKIFGIQDYEQADDAINVRYLYRGVVVGKLLEDLGITYTHFSTRYLAPFHGEIEDLAESGKPIRSEH